MKIVTKGKRDRGIPIFNRILRPLMILLLFEILILFSSIFSSQVGSRLSGYATDVANGKLEARKNYLESVMINNWMNIRGTVTDVNKMMTEMIGSGQMRANEIGQNDEANEAFLVRASKNLLRMMRSNRVTGGYILLYTGAVDDQQEVNIPGLYIHDSDPLSIATERNTDLLLERSPAAVVKSTGIATEKHWSSCFRFDEQNPMSSAPYFYEPYKKAYENPGTYEWENLAYWSSPYELENGSWKRIGYSVPLMLDDGTLYGVLGIDITLDYLRTLLPSQELDGNNLGAYFIAQTNASSDLKTTDGYTAKDYTEVVETGSTSWVGDPDESSISAGEDVHHSVAIDDNEYYVNDVQLQIYDSNAPYSNTNWVLGLVLPWRTINMYSTRLHWMLALVTLTVAVIGIIGSVFISLGIQRPVKRMEEQLENADASRVVSLKATGIREIDEMSHAIENLSADVLTSGRRFSKIIQTSSEKMGGFQIDENVGTLFITDGFFEVFGLPRPSTQTMSIGEFRDVLQSLHEYRSEDVDDMEGVVYEVERDGKKRYVRLRESVEQNVTYGLAEDVTQSLLRHRMLLFERDHDALTGLLNRKAFHTRMNDFRDHQGRRVKVGALLMMDLDNLKTINDSYGHEHGDAYIRMAAKIISESMRDHAICSRISGDEFNVFIYSDSREEIESRIETLQNGFRSASIEVGEGQQRQVRISAGISWYPQDARSYEDLLRFADSALYIAKRSHKGEFETFDLETYEGEGEIQRKREALVRLLDETAVHYVYQPIVSARTGKVFAYEALMRSDIDEFRSPVSLLATAKAEGKMNQIENATVPLAISTFFQYVDNGVIGDDVNLFFNTISNQRLLPESKEKIFASANGRIDRLIMEVTEEEPIEYAEWEEKTSWLAENGGHVALDDYGAGYNSEKTLLAISPDFIKVDIAIIRNIQNSPDKQSIMEYIVNYAHERGKYIIAEGVEDEAETRECIRLGADYLQGYFVSRPQDTPVGIDADITGRIRRMRKEGKES